MKGVRASSLAIVSHRRSPAAVAISSSTAGPVSCAAHPAEDAPGGAHLQLEEQKKSSYGGPGVLSGRGAARGAEVFQGHPVLAKGVSQGGLEKGATENSGLPTTYLGENIRGVIWTLHDLLRQVLLTIRTTARTMRTRRTTRTMASTRRPTEP